MLRRVFLAGDTPCGLAVHEPIEQGQAPPSMIDQDQDQDRFPLPYTDKKLRPHIGARRLGSQAVPNAPPAAAPQGPHTGRRSTDVIDVLPQHVGRDQSNAALCHMVSGPAICLCVESDCGAFGELTEPVDYRPTDTAIAPDIHVR
jgi:hypothetical protein